MPAHRRRHRHGEIGLNGAQNGSSPVDYRMQVGLEFIAFRLEGGEREEGGNNGGFRPLRDGLRRFRAWWRKGDRFGDRFSLARGRNEKSQWVLQLRREEGLE